jgi:regulator of nucleoside diphosphate kinase
MNGSDPIPHDRSPGFRRATSSTAPRVLPMQDVQRLRAVLRTHFAELHRDEAAALARELERATIVSTAEVLPDLVTMNSRVVCESGEGVQHEITLVYPWDHDPSTGRVSVLTPLGFSLVGSRVGAVVAGAGGPTRSAREPLSVTQLLYQPEEAGDLYR